MKASVIIENKVRLDYFKHTIILCIIVLLTLTTVDAKNCKSMCLMFKNYKDIYNIESHRSNMKIDVTSNINDYNYGIKEISWKSKHIKTCNRYNVSRHWTYNFSNDSESCRGYANYADDGEIYFNLNKDQSIGINGETCFHLPGGYIEKCLEKDSIYKDNVFECRVNKTDLDKRAEKVIQYIKSLAGQKNVYVLQNNGVYRADKLIGCHYVRQKQKSMIDINFSPLIHSELCLRGESTPRPMERVNFNLYYDNGIKIINNDVLYPIVECKVKNVEDNCSFGIFKSKKEVYVDIVPICQTNFYMKINNTRKIFPCRAGNIPLIGKNTKYEICGYTSNGTDLNTTYVCDCPGSKTEKYTIEYTGVLTRLTRFKYIKTFKYSIVIIMILWILVRFLSIVLNSETHPIIKRDIINIDHIINTEIIKSSKRSKYINLKDNIKKIKKFHNKKLNDLKNSNIYKLKDTAIKMFNAEDKNAKKMKFASDFTTYQTSDSIYEEIRDYDDFDSDDYENNYTTRKDLEGFLQKGPDTTL